MSEHLVAEALKGIESELSKIRELMERIVDKKHGFLRSDMP